MSSEELRSFAGHRVSARAGKVNLRPYLPEELAAMEPSAKAVLHEHLPEPLATWATDADALGMTADEVMACLGEKTYDIYLNVG